MRQNPLMIVIPCHRVIGADGSLRGYGGLGSGLSAKRMLLELEVPRLAVQQPVAHSPLVDHEGTRAGARQLAAQARGV